MFFAIRGENENGHAFLDDAVSSGAAALVVNADEKGTVSGMAGSVPVIEVEDTVKALQALASAWRDRVDPLVIGITGSTGKTGTKNLAARIASARYRVHSTKGNFNNHIGVPLTILSMPEDTEVLIAEMGANHKKEITLLASIAKPDIGVITNIGPGHLEFFGSLKGVASAKAELVESLESGGTAVLPADDEFFEFLKGRTKAGVLSFGYSDEAVFRIEDVRKKEGAGYLFRLAEAELETCRYGRHHLLNAAAAIAAASKLGISPAEAAGAVASAEAAAGRGEVYEIAGITFIDDSYNSNPASLMSSVDAFMEMEVAGRRWLVLGDMLELGEASAGLHSEMGIYCGKAGVDGLLTLGEDTVELNRAAAVQRKAPGDISHFVDAVKLAAYLDSFLEEGDAVLVKGSRGMRMEKVMEEIELLRKAGKRRIG